MTQIGEASVAELYSSGRFDPQFYASVYRDVGESGLDPGFHFLWVGAKLGRLPRSPEHLLRPTRQEALDVLFVGGTNGTSSTPYRVHRVAAGLAESGVRVLCVSGDELDV